MIFRRRPSPRARSTPRASCKAARRSCGRSQRVLSPAIEEATMSHRKSLLFTALMFASAAALAPWASAQTATAVAPAPQAAAPAPTYPPTINQLIAKTKSEIKTVKMPEFKAAFDKNDLGLIVDVRNENEFEDGFVPGAVNVPRGLIEFRIWKLVGFPDKTDMSKKMTLYCASGGRCALATKTLMELGFTNVTSADMLFADWVKAGYPVEKPKK
jgi:rhodanese-related sulfurtransferase